MFVSTFSSLSSWNVWKYEKSKRRIEFFCKIENKWCRMIWYRDFLMRSKISKNSSIVFFNHFLFCSIISCCKFLQNVNCWFRNEFFNEKMFFVKRRCYDKFAHRIELMIFWSKKISVFESAHKVELMIFWSEKINVFAKFRQLLLYVRCNFLNNNNQLFYFSQ